MFLGAELLAQEDFPNVYSLKNKINLAIKTDLGVAMFYVNLTELFGGDVEKLQLFFTIANLEKITYVKNLNQPAYEENLRTVKKKYIKVHITLLALFIFQYYYIDYDVDIGSTSAETKKENFSQPFIRKAFVRGIVCCRASFQSFNGFCWYL